VATPQTDRITCDELAVLAREFRSTAERMRHTSYVHVVNGRPSVAVRYRTRAWAYDEAARRCIEELHASAHDE
jgi:hypothetical protein